MLNGFNKIFTEKKMENNQTKSCVIKDQFLPKAKIFFTSKTFLVIAACVVCFFVGFFSGNVAGKAAQKKADASLIAAANARANSARYGRIRNVRTPNVRPRVNPQTPVRPRQTVSNRRPVVNRPATITNRPATNRPATTANRQATNK